MEREGREEMILISEVVIRRLMKNGYAELVYNMCVIRNMCSWSYQLYVSYIYIPGCQLYFLGSFGRCGLSSVFSHKDFLHPFPEPTCHETK